MKPLVALAAVALLGAPACGGGDDGPAGPSTVSGSVAGTPWNAIRAAFWIGMGAPGSSPAIVFLSEKRIRCEDISSPNWDDFVDDKQLLELGLGEAAARTFAVPDEASAAYAHGELNPDADSGTITVTDYQPGATLKGSFDLTYGSDRLQGTIEATYCATGVEP